MKHGVKHNILFDADDKRILFFRRQTMSNLSKVVEELYGKSIKECSNEEVYVALLKLTKDALKDKGYIE